MAEPYIFQIVGYQNSGKTTLTTKLISNLKQEGYKIVTMKHHGHGGRPQVVEGKDTSQHIHSGASASLVEGDGRIVVQIEDIKLSLDEKIKMLTTFQPDCILIEGYKYEKYPKLVLIRDDEDLHLLDELKNIIAVIYQNVQMDNYPIPYFHRNDKNSIKWLVDFLKSQMNFQ